MSQMFSMNREHHNKEPTIYPDRVVFSLGMIRNNINSHFIEITLVADVILLSEKISPSRKHV